MREREIGRGVGTGYVSLVALKDAIDTVADWRTPELSGTQYVTRMRRVRMHTHIHTHTHTHDALCWAPRS
jgi:hypothetical protein